jgi:outer membrane protein
MKNISIVINAILIIAVGILYYLHFSCSKTCASPAKKSFTEAKKLKNDSSAVRIAYVDLDSLNEKITFINTSRKALESEQASIELEWENAYKNLENQKNNFLKKGDKITQSEAEEFQAMLYKQQQEVDSKKQTSTQKLNEKSYKIMGDIQLKLKDFLAEFNQDNQYTYIFTTGNGLDYMVYKNEAYNITNEVIEGMNEKMKSEAK